MLTFNLKKEWYDKIASGEKRIEYREVKPYWTKRLNKEIAVYTNMGAVVPCILRLGYTKQQMTAEIVKIEVVNGKDTDLHMDKPVYAIHLANVEEVNWRRKK